MSVAVATAVVLGLVGVTVAVKTLSTSGETTVSQQVGTAQSQTGGAGASVISKQLAKVVGTSYKTSFGVVAVTNVEAISGVTAKAVAGVTHGVQNLVRRGKMQVQVSVELSNTKNGPVHYSPAQFRLHVGPGRVLMPHSATVWPGVLQPGAAINATLSFIGKAAKRQTLVLELRDRGSPVRITLGPVSAFGSVSTKADPYHVHH